ncbi:phosphoadenosine phosphosulfate reductase family protein [Lysinibacillus sphaericus]|uniref:phosphoadenosine phosphosulfate reductase domain-containing protein n=1 Tax=Lysinibacillus sphaericus TaxID=1421 RepID=UPI0018CFEDAD|nr:phosphoadenosine phosphosulfate reductase family protein [Lysinibacillus sphaericus]MBG9756070.1 phosphoadenosine phosphosulfate reductase family protein [Lysinibacillus sphaericus]QTB11739.1 phosphoadenosine phosphosulfate reductase family protein [Lysinibacillus sphaericus]
MEQINIISISGGKDSTALWLYAIERGVEVTTVFADTGHEHPKTYEYIEYLQKKIGPITVVKADFRVQILRKREYIQTKWREQGITEDVIQEALEVLQPTGTPFLDLCLWKGRFPSTKAPFCTQELKIRPIMEKVYIPNFEQGKQIVSWQGIRADESKKRSKMPEREDTPEGFEIYRPLIKWTVEDVFAMHNKYGIEPNPLYKEGMNRVGCMPCINSNKWEIYEIARRYPEVIERISLWEKIIAKASKRGASSFFPHSEIAGYNIHDYVEWSKTSFGGLQYDLEKLIGFDKIPMCSSQYGLCE